jgi:hypothetical protein
MKIYINLKEIDIFSGACIKDAVLSYDKTAWQLLLKGKLAAVDRYGNRIESDGSLSDGQVITLIPIHSL